MAEVFASFPAFTPVSAQHRSEYQALMSQFPPLSDLSFTTGQLWWNANDRFRIARLHGNVVIAYDAPGKPNESGLCLVGTDRVPASLDQIFAHLKERQKPLRVVHVPEFVAALAPPQRYDVREEAAYHEYLVPVSNLFPLESCPTRFRYKVRKLVSSVGDQSIDVRRLDLGLVETQRLLLDRARAWPGSRNDLKSAELEVLATAVLRAADLEIHNLCLFVDGELRLGGSPASVPPDAGLSVQSVPVARSVGHESGVAVGAVGSVPQVVGSPGGEDQVTGSVGDDGDAWGSGEAVG